MCGIAGILSEQYIKYKYIQDMTNIIVHRGPDSGGHQNLLNGKVWIGHRRLSILDLSISGKQPMSYDDGRYWITYNGEIYNYIEIREELMQLGYQFKSNSDTEVIMAAYAYWGKNCLHKFNGMWAFILIDVKEHKMFAARDRFGVKPFYLWKSSEGFWAFASEIKQFTVLPGWKPHINGQRVYDFLNWGLTNHTEETLFADVMQLRGGQAFECSINVVPPMLPIYQWYVLKAQQFSGNLQDAAEVFRELFTDAVRLRLRSDVKIGSCLSGGLDSSSIVCVVNELLKGTQSEATQRTVSACAYIKKYDEREYIDEVLKQRGIHGYYTYIDLDVLIHKLDEILWHQDEPFGSTSICAQWSVFELAAKQGLKVMLDGQGADEQLAGYHTFFGARFTSLFKTLRWMKLLSEVKRSKELHDYNLIFAMKGIANAMFPENIRNRLREYCGHSSISPAWIDREKLKAEIVNPFTQVGAKALNIRELSIAQLTSSNLQMLLHWEDRNSMAHSVESRLPFLDYRLVELTLGLPDDYKLSDGITKKVLREGMVGILPDRIRMRMDKMGFVTPEEVWMKKNMEYLLKMVCQSVESADGILTRSVIEQVQRMLNGREKFSFMPWRVISFGRWIEIYGIKQ